MKTICVFAFLALVSVSAIAQVPPSRPLPERPKSIGVFSEYEKEKRLLVERIRHLENLVRAQEEKIKLLEEKVQSVERKK